MKQKLKGSEQSVRKYIIQLEAKIICSGCGCGSVAFNYLTFRAVFEFGVMEQKSTLDSSPPLSCISAVHLAERSDSAG